MRLSDKCRKEALKDPQGCKTRAVADADSRCKGLTGMARGNCMNANFERALGERCGEIVCPGDPFMFKETGASTSSRTTAERAGEGGQFTRGEQELVLTQQFEDRGIQQGMSADKMKIYLAVGIGVVVLLSMTVKKK